MLKRKRDKDVEFYETKKKKEFEFYKQINIELYKKNLMVPLKLWNMDKINASLGTTTKLWWQRFFKNKFKNKKILDIGCGNNYLIPYWASNGNKVSGIDSSKTSLDILSMFLKRLKLKAKLKKGFVEDTVLKEKFDIISFNNMLHHVESIPKSLENAKKMLKKDGFVLIVEPLYHFPFRWIVETDFLKNVNPFRSYFIKKDVYYDEEKALGHKKYLKYIKKSGFEISYLKYDLNFLGYALTVLKIKNRKLKKFVYEFDKIFTKIFVPKKFRSFIYIIAKHKKNNI